MVSGASRGLGRELAFALVGAGARVAILASRISAALRETEAALIAAGGKGTILTLPTDVRSAAACERSVRAVLGEFGRLDVVVNAANVDMRRVDPRPDGGPARFWETSAEAWDDIVTTHVHGAFHLARAAVPAMLRGGYGRIVNVGATPDALERPSVSPLAAAKVALESMTRIWAADLAGTPVTCNLLEPGDRAKAALLWLLSDAAAGVTGERIAAPR